MGNVEAIMIKLAITVSIMFFLLPLMLWIHNIVDRLKLSKINSIEEFKEKMKWRMLPGKKWFKPATLTRDEIVNEFMRMEEKLQKSRLINITLRLVLAFIFFSFYVSLAEDIGYYYIKFVGYEIPQKKFILGELVTLVILSSWIAFVLFRNLAIYRIKMFLEKFKEFESRKHIEVKDI